MLIMEVNSCFEAWKTSSYVLRVKVVGSKDAFFWTNKDIQSEAMGKGIPVQFPLVQVVTASPVVIGASYERPYQRKESLDDRAPVQTAWANVVAAVEKVDETPWQSYDCPVRFRASK